MRICLDMGLELKELMVETVTVGQVSFKTIEICGNLFIKVTIQKIKMNIHFISFLRILPTSILKIKVKKHIIGHLLNYLLQRF